MSDATDSAADLRGDATEATRAANAEMAAGLDFADRRDFDEAGRGLIAPLPDGGRVLGADGGPVWDLSRFDFIAHGGEAPATVNPSLWRQSQLVVHGAGAVLPAPSPQARRRARLLPQPRRPLRRRARHRRRGRRPCGEGQGHRADRFLEAAKAVTAAENCCHTLHNTYSLRGAKIRDPLAWSKYLQRADRPAGATASR